jgi:betaine lipid synthase
VIPPFIDAVDNAAEWLAPDGLMGVCDFYVSARYDVPMRQMPWARRFFWRAVFDIDSIDVGPERRAYLETKLERAWEFNGQGSIPCVPYLCAPWFAWVGRPWADAAKQLVHEQRVEAPPLFPPTFLYTQSWEDPEPDMKVMSINADDTVLTLTSGGCNALNLLLHGAGHVVSVDCNPAQSSLLELKKAAISTLCYEDVWQMFGEGKHPDIEALFERKLAPFLSQKAIDFWSTRLWYFKQGLYYQGGMGKLCWVLQVLARATGLGGIADKLVSARDLDEQRAAWNAHPLVRFVKHGPSLLVWLFCRLIALLLFNRLVLWFGGGVPCKQYKLIVDDGVPIEHYIGRTMDGVAEHSHLRTRNYFYYNCLTGRFARGNCPSYLSPRGFASLQAGAIDRLTISSGFFQDELRARMYTKVILMDHVDWLDDDAVDGLANALSEHVAPGGIVIWRSASLEPPYVRKIEAAGFDVRCLQRATDGYMDRVNMYSSFYVATRRAK